MVLLARAFSPDLGPGFCTPINSRVRFEPRTRNSCFSSAHIFCRLRDKTAWKKIRARKPRERLAVDAEGSPVEEPKVEASDASTTNEENAPPSPRHDPFFASRDHQQRAQATEPDKRKPFGGISVENLLLLIREAEKNILLLNQVRARALEDLEQARQEQDNLNSEVKALQKRLAEASAKIKLAEQVKAKNVLLENEVRYLQQKLREKAEATLQQSSSVVEIKGGMFMEEVESLKMSLLDLKDKDELLNQLQADRTLLQEKLQALELKLEANTVSLKELENAKNENESLREDIRKLQIELRVAELTASEASKVAIPEDLLSDAEGSNSSGKRLLLENHMLQEQVKRLLIELAQADSSRALLEQTQAENRTLREQVQMLQHKLLESDAEIRTQLQAYQAEVEGFQNSLQKLKSQKKPATFQVPAGEMPWQFWSSLLLRIDSWLLEKALSAEDAEELRLMTWRRDSRLREKYVELKDKNGEDILAGLLELTQFKKRPGLYVVHIAAEMAPVAKVGGLGDVVTGLGRALQRKDHLVEIILPKYDCIDYGGVKDLKVVDAEFASFFDNQMFKNKIWMGTVEDLPVYFIEPFHPGKFFWRNTFYGERDDFRRFLYFSRAALEFLYQSNKRPDVIHSHDWTTAAVAPLYWDIYAPLGFNSARLAFTCHNFEYQGTESPSGLAACGLNVQQQFRQDRMQDSFMHDKVNLLKGGVVYSNIVTTVSPTYAQEVRAPEGGRGLQVALSIHSNKFYGILNGIDVDAWDPSSDSILEYNYSSEDLSGKAANKSALQQRLQLTVDPKKPLVGCITRLVPQKGVQLIRHAIHRTAEKGGQFVLLGTSPIAEIQHEFERLAHKFENHPDIRLVLKYDESLAHCIYAASDIFTIPSLFEPCGLTQMIAMRYGSIPVVRRTGGLNDSVFDVDDKTIPEDKRNGFSFSSTEVQGLNYALDRALAYYRSKPDWWNQLVKKAMKLDFSWDSSADQYIELYQQAMARARARAVAPAV